MPTCLIRVHLENLPSFDSAPEIDIVWGIGKVPPLGMSHAEPVRVYTYEARWLALQALWRMAQAEHAIRSLPLPDAHMHLHRQQVRERESIHWSIAVLELVLLYRLHLQISSEPSVEYGVRLATQLPNIAALARDCDKAVFVKVHDSLKLKANRTGHDESVNDPIIAITDGTIADCAQALMHFLQSKCRIEHTSDNHAAWLGSIWQLVYDVLFLFHEQVCASLCTSSLLPARLTGF